MNEIGKELLMNAVVSGTIREIRSASSDYKQVFEERYFNYNLLQAALHRNHKSILNFLINEIGSNMSLHLAMKLDSEYVIKRILSKKVLIFEKDENGEIPLLTGFKNKHYNAVRALLTHCKPHCYNEKDFLLHFHIATVTNHVDAVERYLIPTIDPNIPLSIDSEEYFGLNPVQFAAENNYFELFLKLVSHGGDLSIINSKGLTPLHIMYYTSLSKGVRNLQVQIKEIFEIGNDTKFVNTVDGNGLSHFHMCCLIDEPEFVQVFIDNGANVNSSIYINSTIHPGYTPLHFAVENGCKRVVELLLRNSADCNVIDKAGRTPLHLVSKILGYYKANIVKDLLDYQANPAITDTEENTPLHIEFYYGNSKGKNIFDMMFSKISRKINFTNNQGLSHFHIACATNNINQVNHFLESGVNVNDCVSSGMYKGYTALHFAALYNQKDVVELLLEKDAQVNVKTSEFQVTPLHLACEFNYVKFRGKSRHKNVESCESFPVNLNSTFNLTNQLDIINLILLQGAEVDAKDYQGMTPLLHTCMIDRNYCKLNWSCTSYLSTSDIKKDINTRIKEIVELLFSNKAKVNICTNRKESVLHVLSKYRSLQISKKLINLILNEGADINGVDDSGLTPLHVAVKANNNKMVQILLKYNADVNIRCSDSKIPLHGLFSTQPLSTRPFLTKSTREIFCSLLENGSDVNIIISERNIILLHAAIYMKDNFMIDQLLNYGADINTEDSFGNYCTSEIIQWAIDNPTFRSDYDIAKIFQIVYIHVQKLLALGSPVSEDVQKHCKLLYYYHNAVLIINNKPISEDNTFDTCTEEIEKMKLIKISNYTSLYEVLLLKDPQELSKHARNENLIKIIKARSLSADFPLYGNLLKVQLTRGLRRKHILETAKISLSKIINTHLPDLCCYMILNNLENKDFAAMKIAAISNRSSKRKMKDIKPPSSNKRRKVDD